MLHNLENIGIEHKNVTLNENSTCPLNSNSESAIDVALDPVCNLTNFEPNSYLRIRNYFRDECLGEQNCTFKVDTSLFPDSCLGFISNMVDKTRNEELLGWQQGQQDGTNEGK